MDTGNFDMSSFNTPFPNPSGYGGDEANNGAGVTPSHQMFFQPFSPYPEIPTTYQPMGTHNFSHGPGISQTVSEPTPVFSMDMFLPPVNPSPSPFQVSPAPVANYTMQPQSPAPMANYTVQPRSPAPVGNYTVHPQSPAPMANYTVHPQSPAQMANYTVQPQSPAQMANYTVQPRSPAPVANYTVQPRGSPAPVANYTVQPRGSPAAVANRTAGLPPRPPGKGNSTRGSSGSNQTPRKTHSRNNSNGMSVLDSMVVPNSPKLIIPKPIPMQVGENSGNNVASQGDTTMEDSSYSTTMVEMNALNNSDSYGNRRTSGAKRRAGKDIASSSPRKHSRSDSLESCSDGKGSLPAFAKGTLTASELQQVLDCDYLTSVAREDPKKAKRILSNRLSAARSKDRRTQYLFDLERKANDLKTVNIEFSAKIRHLESEKMNLEIENKELKIRMEVMNKEARFRDIVSEQLSGEVLRLRMAMGKVNYNGAGSSSGPNMLALIPNMHSLNPNMHSLNPNMQPLDPNMQPLDPNMYQNLNMNQFHQPPQFNPDFQ